jgi:hypothetical protein
VTLREAIEVEMRRLLAGCSKCEYDEAEGGIVNHCDACCRKFTTAGWRWAHAPKPKPSPKTRSGQ